MRKVSHAKFHQTVYVPGVGEIGSTLPSANKNYPGLDMATDGITLRASFRTNSGSISVEIPCANIISMVMIPEDKA